MWRYYAMRALTREWLDRELPLSGVRLTPRLSGPYQVRASIEPEYEDLIGDDGLPVLQEWSTLIFAEASGRLRGGGIVTSVDMTGSTLDLTIDGISAYPAGMPITTTLTWGGANDGTSGNGVDPLDVVRAIWDHLQAQPDGDLGVTYTDTSTPYRLGEWHNARRRDQDGELDDDATAVQDPPIPIDRVWGKQDKKPVAAQGKTLFWRYRIAWWDDTEAGQHIDQLAGQVPFDWREQYEWADSSKEDVVMQVQFGYPRLGKRQTNLRFVQDENIVELLAIKRDGDQFANEVRAYGSGEGSKQVRQTVRRRDGRLRRARTEDHSDVDRKSTLRSLAEDELLRTSGLTDITQVVIRDHPNAPIGSFDVGDDIQVEGYAWGRWVRLWVRITSFDFSPEDGDITISCSRSDRFRYGGGI